MIQLVEEVGACERYFGEGCQIVDVFVEFWGLSMRTPKSRVG